MGGNGAQELLALAAANTRYWPTVAPVVQRELRRWEPVADAIEEPRLRALALGKLRHEHFNAEVAATLATLAPRTQRARVARAIVALELLFDYLDGRTEPWCAYPLEDADRLFEAFVEGLGDAVDGASEARVDGAAEPPDSAYLSALSAYARAQFTALPGAGLVAEQAGDAASRCAQAQVRLHASGYSELDELERWARTHGADSGLEWREYVAGCASSVLAAHALIAAASEAQVEARDARAIDHAYLAIAAVITILDSVVDEAQDRAQGRRGFIALYEPGELAGRLRTLTREALARAREAPHSAHHVMTLAGVVAYYTTHPGAREAGARQITQLVRAELAPAVWPAVGVLGCWRAAKRRRGASCDTAGVAIVDSADGAKR